MVKKCVLCNMTVDDPVKLGQIKTCPYKKKKISAHYYCLLLTTQLMQNGADHQGILGFLPADIMQEKQRISNQICHYCKNLSANIACCARKCLRQFHLYCGLEQGAFCHFENDFRTICPKHLTSERKKCTQKDNCVICFESMGNYSRAFSMLSPCCRTGWFHKWCIAKFALNAGYFFKCPLCNNKEVFRAKLVRRGIFVPDQDAAWELEPNAFAELLERPDRCSADNCLCPRGRDYQRGNYELITCSTCGSKAVHSQCMKTPSKTYSCDACTDIGNNSQMEVSNVDNNDNNNVLAENDEIEVVDLDKHAEASSDNESVDSLLLTFVRGKDEEISENIGLADSSSVHARSKRISPKKSLQNITSAYRAVSDIDLNIIYQTTRKRKTSFRRFNSDHSNISPKRKKYSTTIKRSLSFESMNKSMCESDDGDCCADHDSNVYQIDLTALENVSARLFADSPKSNKYPSLQSNCELDSLSKLSTTPNTNSRLTTNSSASAVESLTADQGTASPNMSNSPESCKSKDTDCSSSGVSSLSPETSPKGDVAGGRLLPSSVVPLKDSSTGPSYVRIRNRAASMFIDRCMQNSERQRSLRNRSQSVDKPLNVRRSLRLYEKARETEICKDVSAERSRQRRKSLVRKISLFRDNRNCDN